ncbi:MAG TPA: glycine zipper family protein [Fontimonas sp.]
MPQLKICLALIGTLALGGCASDGPIIDTQNTDMVRYEQDLAQCRAYGDQVATGKQAGAGAVGGAAVGAVLGAIVGNSSTVARGAGVGGVLGGVRGASKGASEKDVVVKNCLRGRGYRVLN